MARNCQLFPELTGHAATRARLIAACWEHRASDRIFRDARDSVALRNLIDGLSEFSSAASNFHRS